MIPRLSPQELKTLKAASRRERVGKTPRAKIAQRKRLDLFVEQRGRCAECDGKFPLADLELDHRIPLALGGTDERRNWQLLCNPCHAAKTAFDQADIAKAKRREAKDQGTFPESKFKLRGRGFPMGRNRAFAREDGK